MFEDFKNTTRHQFFFIYWILPFNVGYPSNLLPAKHSSFVVPIDSAKYGNEYIICSEWGHI